MSSVINEHNVDNSSTNKVVNIHSSINTTNINNLIDRIQSIDNNRLDNAQQYKSIFNQHSMQPIISQILCEIKDKIRLNPQQMPSINNSLSEQLMRVDNMLSAEGISGDNLLNDSSDHLEYQEKLSQIKKIYNDELTKSENHCDQFCSHVRTLLHEQSYVRPISQHEIELMIIMIRRKFSIIQLQIKQNTCESLMILRSRFLDARRKRKNFSKTATETLNKYFYSHLSNPYPSEEVKEDLARQCGISMAQINNWFGNKRIRYKKNPV